MAGDNTVRIVLQPRDRALLATVEAVGVLDREQAKVAGPFHSTTRANARLLALTKAGLLSRTFLGTIAGGRKAIYVSPNRKRIAASAPHLEHQLMVAGIYHAFRRVSRGPGLRVDWQTFGTPVLAGSRLIPDGLLQIRSATERVSVFVEADRGTEPLAVWRRKAEKYLELALGAHHEPVCGAGPFQVVVVAEDERRARSVARAIGSVTHKLFWITSAEILQNRGPGASIWLRPDGSSPEDVPWNQ